MPLPKDQAWFPAKRYGWGWGLPQRRPGWVVLAIFLAALIAGAPLARHGAVGYVGYVVALAALLVLVCWWKGERPRWRWGGE
ncbi:MAG TPA: hypothetical protein VHE13_16210 [Opitutus sp.]|nr:hypothetical protein [Opitutus sp.]